MKKRKSLHRKGKQNVSFSVANYWFGKKVFAFFKFPRTVEKVLEVSIRRVYKGGMTVFNENKTIDMDVDLKLEMKISCRELRVVLFHEFRLGRKATEATSNICGLMDEDALSIHTA